MIPPERMRSNFASADFDWSKTIHELFEQVWSASLGASIRKRTSSPIDRSREVVRNARVAIRGDWSGEVVLSCPESSAREFAAALHRSAAQTLQDDDVRGTLRELVNILGGNLKSSLPGRHELSIPHDGDDVRAADIPAPELAPACGTVCELELDFHGWPMRLSIVERR